MFDTGAGACGLLWGWPIQVVSQTYDSSMEKVNEGPVNDLRNIICCMGAV